ncbi:MAG: hypothetical protein ABI304_03535 [Rudaea sp.]
MKQVAAREPVRRARQGMDQAEGQLATGWRQRREKLERHRLGVLIGAGLLSGIALTTVSPQRWSGVGAAVFGSGAWLARSAVGPALIGALLTSIFSRPKARDRDAPQHQCCSNTLGNER